MSMNKKRIVVTGLGVVSPIGIGKAAFLESIKAGRSGVGKVSFFDVSTYPCHIDAEVKGFQADQFMDRKKVKRMDPVRPVRHGGGPHGGGRFGDRFHEGKSGTVRRDRGLRDRRFQTIEEEHSVLLEKGMKRVSPFLIPMLISNIASGEIAIEYGITGPNYSVSSACATANHALGASFGTCGTATRTS
jgi:3-oxoacyl-[acyl-carrier-protein] synthase II